MNRQTRYFVTSDAGEERSYAVETLADGSYQVQKPDGSMVVIDAFSAQPGQLHLMIENRSLDVDVREGADAFHVQLDGHVREISVLNERQKRMQAAGIGSKKAAGPQLTSPMAGKVVAVMASVGAEVVEGQTIVIIEAMKMENDIKAHRDGVIGSLGVEQGQLVEVGSVLVTIEDKA